ncbi:hypothetical protein D3C73_780670 [compost metagenome]
MAEFVRGDEGPVQRVLQARTDADFAFRLGLSTLRFLLDLAPQIVHIDLELFQDRLDDVRGGQCQQQMFGIDLAAPEFPGLLCGILQQLVALFAQPVSDGASAAAPRSTPRRALAESGVDDSVVAVTRRAERAASQRTVTKEAAETALAEEFVKKGTPSEQGLQRRGAAPRPARHFAVMLVAKLHVLNPAVHRGAHARRRRATANIASSVCHWPSPFLYPVRVVRRSSAPVTVSRSDRFRSFHLGTNCHQIGLVQCLSLQEILRRLLEKIQIGFKKGEGALEHAIHDVAHL